MSKDMTSDLLKAVVKHADGQIEKHKVNVLVQCKNSIYLVLQNMVTM